MKKYNVILLLCMGACIINVIAVKTPPVINGNGRGGGEYEAVPTGPTEHADQDKLEDGSTSNEPVELKRSARSSTKQSNTSMPQPPLTGCAFTCAFHWLFCR